MNISSENLTRKLAGFPVIHDILFIDFKSLKPNIIVSQTDIKRLRLGLILTLLRRPLQTQS